MSHPSHDCTIDGDHDNVKDSEMDIKTVTDKFGKTMRFQIIDGRHYIPMYHPTIIKEIKDLPMRPDDIYLSAFPRTGTHWTFEMTSMLLNGNAETVQKSKAKNQLEFISSDKLNLISSPAISCRWGMNCSAEALRCYTDCVRKELVVVLHGRGLQLSEHLDRFGNGITFCQTEADGIFGHWRDAENFFEENPDIPVHFQIYEETLKDPVSEVQKLSDFIGLPRNDELCRAIAEKCRFDKMVVDKDEYSIKVDGKNSLYRKGIVGDWKNWFTDEMLEDFYRVYDEQLKESRFYQRYARQS